MEGKMKTIKAVTIFSHHIQRVIYLATVEDTSNQTCLVMQLKAALQRQTNILPIFPPRSKYQCNKAGLFMSVWWMCTLSSSSTGQSNTSQHTFLIDYFIAPFFLCLPCCIKDCCSDNFLQYQNTSSCTGSERIKLDFLSHISFSHCNNIRPLVQPFALCLVCHFRYK